MADEGRSAKRARLSDDRLAVLDLLACVGDRAKTADAVCEQISLVVRALLPRLTGADRESLDSIGYALLRCGTELPYKSGVYATVAGLLAADPDQPRSAELATRLGAAVCHELAGALRDGKAALARRALRYVAELTRAAVIAPASLVAVLDVLLDAADAELSQPLRGANNVHARGEFLADVALSSLPWCGAFLRDEAADGCEGVLARVRSIRDAWMPNRWRAVAVGDTSLASESFDELLKAVFDVVETDWAVSPDALPAYCARFAEELASAPRVTLDPFVLPAHSKLTRYTPPRFRLCLLSTPERRHVPGAGRMTGVDGESRPRAEANGGAAADGGGAVADGGEAAADGGGKAAGERPEEKEQLPVDRYVLRQYVADVLDNFVSDHVKGAERLLTVPMLLEANDVIVETVFSEMCATPTATNPAIYYGSVFVDLCKVKDSRLPIKLLAAVEKMFQDAGSLEEEVFDRLTEWFSFHLSNFGYKWNWADWAVYADADMVDKFPFRALFCRDVLDRVVRLSYRDRIAKMVPEEMAFFLPPPIGTGNTVRFNADINEQLLKVVAGAGKQPPPVVQETLSTLLPSAAFEGDEKRANLARLVALTHAILQGSSRTLSHFDTLVERYMPLLSTMSAAGGVAARKAVTLEAGVFWSSSHLRTLYVLDKLSTYRVIDGLAILDYLFSDTGVDMEAGEAAPMSPLRLCARLEESPVWELARLVLARARSRLEGARAELTSASGAASHATEGAAEKVEERLNKAKAGAQNAKAEVSQLVLLGLRRLFMLSDMIFNAQQEQPDMQVAEAASGAGSDAAPPPTNGHVFSWRALGMMREMGRKHPEQIEALLDDIRDETSEARERHPALQDAFEVLEEIAGCDIAC